MSPVFHRSNLSSGAPNRGTLLKPLAVIVTQI